MKVAIRNTRNGGTLKGKRGMEVMKTGRCEKLAKENIRKGEDEGSEIKEGMEEKKDGPS